MDTADKDYRISYPGLVLEQHSGGANVERQRRFAPPGYFIAND